MAVLEAELEQLQSGKKEQIVQLQSEIAAMETTLQGMTEVSYTDCVYSVIWLLTDFRDLVEIFVLAGLTFAILWKFSLCHFIFEIFVIKFSGICNNKGHDFFLFYKKIGAFVEEYMMC